LVALPPDVIHLTTAKAFGLRSGQRCEVIEQSALTSVVGTKRTYRDVRYRSAFEGKADISQRLPNNRDL
jgi:hypothetical protein